MTDPEVHEIYEQLGKARLTMIVAAFYRRVSADEVLRPMYPEQDLTGAEDRLRSFLVYRFGGPADYTEQRGHPRLRLRHAPFPVTETARDRWMQLMSEAIEECDVPSEVSSVMTQFLAGTATFLINAPTE